MYMYIFFIFYGDGGGASQRPRDPLLYMNHSENMYLSLGLPFHEMRPSPRRETPYPSDCEMTALRHSLLSGESVARIRGRLFLRL